MSILTGDLRAWSLSYFVLCVAVFRVHVMLHCSPSPRVASCGPIQEATNGRLPKSTSFLVSRRHHNTYTSHSQKECHLPGGQQLSAVGGARQSRNL